MEVDATFLYSIIFLPNMCHSVAALDRFFNVTEFPFRFFRSPVFQRNETETGVP